MAVLTESLFATFIAPARIHVLTFNFRKTFTFLRGKKKKKSTRKSHQETRSSFQQERGKKWHLILLASAWKCTSFCFLYETNKKPSDYLSLVIFPSLDFGHLLYHSEGPITEWKLHRRDLFTFLPQLSPFLKCWPFKTLSRTLPRASTEKWKFPLIAN